MKKKIVLSVWVSLTAFQTAMAADIYRMLDLPYSSNQDRNRCLSASLSTGGLSTDDVVIGGQCEAFYLGSGFYKYTLKARVAVSSLALDKKVLELGVVNFGNTNCTQIAYDLNALSSSDVTLSTQCQSQYLGSNHYTYKLSGRVILHPNE